MRIAVFATFYYPHVGGYEKNVSELATRLVQCGHIVDVITCNTNRAFSVESNGNLRIFRLPCWNLLGGTYPIPKPSFGLFKRIWGNRYDVVSTQTRFFSLTVFGLFFAWAKHIPLIHTERGTRHSVVENKLVDLLSQAVDHIMGRLIASYATHCVGVSSAACEFMRHMGISKSVRIPNGVDIPQEMWQSNGQDVVCFVGRLIKAKGVQDLISVWGRVRSEFPQSELVIVGDGIYRKELECMSVPSIKFVGEKSSPEIKQILLSSSVFVNPSYSEGLPTSVMEAAALGMPIVATDVGGTSELIRHRHSGWIIKAGDRDALYTSLLSLLGNSGLAICFGMEARRSMASYSWDAIVKQYEALFDGGH